MSETILVVKYRNLRKPKRHPIVMGCPNCGEQGIDWNGSNPRYSCGYSRRSERTADGWMREVFTPCSVVDDDD